MSQKSSPARRSGASSRSSSSRSSSSRSSSARRPSPTIVNSTWELLSDKAPFAVQEAYKALRTNVMFSLPGNDSKCIGITSGLKGEGKSSTLLNLAISFGQIGKRVLLIDCDLRLPTIAAKLGIEGEPGLSNIVVGEGRIEDSLRTIPQYGITVLPAGTIPPDPTMILESNQMAIALSVLRKYFDYIFVDLPPVNTVTDAAILAKHLDGFLLVVRHNVGEYKEVNAMINQIRMTGTKILGLVYNDVPVAEKKYYKSKYGYDSYDSYAQSKQRR